MKKTIALIVALLLLSTTLVSCFGLKIGDLFGKDEIESETEDGSNKDTENNDTDSKETEGDKDEQTESQTGSGSESESESNEGSEEGSESQKAETEVIVTAKEKKCKYRIIYPDGATTTVKAKANTLKYNIDEKYEVDISCTLAYDEWGGFEKYEIVIGMTARPESSEATALLDGIENGYVIKFFESGRIAIVATSDTALITAIDEFNKTFVQGGDSDAIRMEIGYEAIIELEKPEEGKWSLTSAVPEYTDGWTAKDFYYIGPSGAIKSGTNAGKMHVISDTSLNAFNEYVELLKSTGFVADFVNEYNGNKYVQLVKRNDTNVVNKSVYLYYLDYCKEVRVIEETSSGLIAVSDFEYKYTPVAGNTTSYYQYGMMHDPGGAGEGQESDGKWGNNGAFDIIKLADNKLIIIDGGYNIQATDDTAAALVDFLREITGTPEGEKVTIAAWYLTHAHGDHHYFARLLAKNHSDEVQFERIMHNIPSNTVMGYGNDTNETATEILKNNKGVKFLKLHTGQKFQLGNVTVDVLMTHEDSVSPLTGKTLIRDGNNTCPVLKFSFGDKAVMYFGDWGGNDMATTKEGTAQMKEEEFAGMQERLLKPYTLEDGSIPILKADIVQIAHHAINYWLDDIYAIIDADYAFFSQADVVYDKLYYPCYKMIADSLHSNGMAYENMYFAGRQTNGLTFNLDGNVTYFSKPIEGAPDEYWTYIDQYGVDPWINSNFPE